MAMRRGFRDPNEENNLEESGQFNGPPNFGEYYNNPSNGGGINPNPGGVDNSPQMPTMQPGMNPSMPMHGQGGSANQWTPEYITNYIQSKSGGKMHGTSPDYWMSKKAELDARGQQIGNPNYANDRLAAADEIIGGPQNSPYRESGGNSGMNLGWLLQMLSQRMGSQPNSQIQMPTFETAQPVDLNQIIMQALQRGF